MAQSQKVSKVEISRALNPKPTVVVLLKAQSLVAEQKVASHSKKLHPILGTSLSPQNLVTEEKNWLHSNRTLLLGKLLKAQNLVPERVEHLFLKVAPDS